MVLSLAKLSAYVNTHLGKEVLMLLLHCVRCEPYTFADCCQGCGTPIQRPAKTLGFPLQNIRAYHIAFRC